MLNTGLILIQYFAYVVVALAIMLIVRKFLPDIERKYFQRAAFMLSALVISVIIVTILKYTIFIDRYYVKASPERPAIIFNEAGRPVAVVIEPILSTNSYFTYDADIYKTTYAVQLTGQAAREYRRVKVLVDVYYKVCNPQDKLDNWPGLRPHSRGENLESALQDAFQKQGTWEMGSYDYKLEQISFPLGVKIIATEYFLDPPVPYGPGA